MLDELERNGMKIQASQWSRMSAGALCIGLLAGCSSNMATIVAKPPVNAQKLGHVEATCGGAHILLASPAYFVPIRLNSCAERAYRKALSQAPGATALTNVTLQEDWYWFVVGSMRRVTVSGEAVK